MKLYVTIIEIDSAVYAEVEVDSEGDMAREVAEHEICHYHVAKYVASGLYDAESPECKAWTVQVNQPSAGFWDSMKEYANNPSKEEEQ